MDAATRVLLVDDEPLVRRTLQRLLQRAGFEVVTAGDAGEAIATAAEAPVDAIVTDLHLPGMSGGALITALRDRLGDRCPTIILASGDTSSATARAVIADTGCPAITKPFASEELVALLHRSVGERRVA